MEKLNYQIQNVLVVQNCQSQMLNCNLTANHFILSTLFCMFSFFKLFAFCIHTFVILLITFLRTFSLAKFQKTTSSNRHSIFNYNLNLQVTTVYKVFYFPNPKYPTTVRQCIHQSYNCCVQERYVRNEDTPCWQKITLKCYRLCPVTVFNYSFVCDYIKQAFYCEAHTDIFNRQSDLV